MNRLAIVFIFFIMDLVIFLLPGFAQSKCYIFVDNSDSMKYLDFYDRIINTIIDKETQYEYHFVPFGTGYPMVFDMYSPFSEFIKNPKNTSYTTDFMQLAQFILDKVRPGNDAGRDTAGDKIIIITDGEHDITDNPPFSNLSGKEVSQMLNVIDRLTNFRKNIDVVHILKSPGYEALRREYPGRVNLKYMNRLLPPDSSTVSETDANVIKGLTHDFMMQLAGEDKYFHCIERHNAVQALYSDIFQISSPVPCDESIFLRNIPIQVKMRVPFAQRDTIRNFEKYLSRETFCLDGIERSIKVSNSQDFKLTIHGGEQNIYEFRLNGDLLAPPMRIMLEDDCLKAVGLVSEKLKEIFTSGTRYQNDPRLMEPRCLVTLKFQGSLLFPFLSGDNFEIERRTCDGMKWQPVAAEFPKKGNRVSLHVPMTNTLGLRITLPHDNNLSHTIPLDSNMIKQYWEKGEMIINDSRFKIPTVTCDFTQYLTQKGGRIVFFSAENKRYAGKLQQPGAVHLYEGQKYWFYHIPDDLAKGIIKFDTRKILDASSIGTTIKIFQKAEEKAILPSENFFTDFRDAGKDEIKKSQVIKRILDSNGYLHLLLNLREIKSNDDDRETFMEIIDVTDKVFFQVANTERPFKIINLITSDIPGLSESLKREYLKTVPPEYERKMHIIINLLGNAFHNLRQLKCYLDPLCSREKISKQNLNYFGILEGE